MAVTDIEAIQRKSTVPDDVRTPGKDDVAQYIEDEILAKGRWPISTNQIAEETDYSRTTVSHTLQQYFEPVEQHSDGGQNTIQIPTDVDERSYLRGFLDGLSR